MPKETITSLKKENLKLKTELKKAKAQKKKDYETTCVECGSQRDDVKRRRWGVIGGSIEIAPMCSSCFTDTVYEDLLD